MSQIESLTNSVNPNITAILKLFDNQPDLLSPKTVAEIIGLSVTTIYDWKYRSSKYDIPEGMLFKFGRRLKVVKPILIKWLISRSERVESEV